MNPIGYANPDEMHGKGCFTVAFQKNEYYSQPVYSAALALLPGEPKQWEINPLEWHAHRPLAIGNFHNTLDTDGEKVYMIFERAHDGIVTLTRRGIACGEYSSLEEAKSAAQADHEPRIRANLRASSAPHLSALADAGFQSTADSRIAELEQQIANIKASRDLQVTIAADEEERARKAETERDDLRSRLSTAYSVREWTCDDCGSVNDRDVNAARNILRIGLDTLAEGTAQMRSGQQEKNNAE
jgi:hypothetical protein